MDFPIDKKSRGLICIHFLICLKIFFLSGTTRSERQEKWEGQKRFFLWWWKLLLTFLFKPLSFGVDLIERCFSLKIFNLHPISLQRWVPKRPDFNKPKRYQYINNHTNNNHHEDVNTTLQGGPKRPDRRQVESHVRSSRVWGTPARDWSRRPRSGS